MSDYGPGRVYKFEKLYINLMKYQNNSMALAFTGERSPHHMCDWLLLVTAPSTKTTQVCLLNVEFHVCFLQRWRTLKLLKVQITNLVQMAMPTPDGEPQGAPASTYQTLGI